MYIGNEPLQVCGHDISLTINDFWRWAGSDLSNRDTRSIFAKFLVASSLDILSEERNPTRNYDLLWPQQDSPGIRINVRTAAYVQSYRGDLPDRITFSIGRREYCDVYVFCLYKALNPDKSPLETDLWDFYALCSSELIGIRNGMLFATLPAIISLGAIWCDYYGIGGTIQKAMLKI